MRMTQNPMVGGLNLFQSTQDSSFATMVGQKFTIDGGESEVALVYATTAIAAGRLVQAPPIIPNHTNCAVVGAATVNVIGSTFLTITLGATLATAQQYQNGYAFVTAGLGAGQKLKIQNNPAAALSTAMTLVLEDPLAIALDTTSRVSLTPNPYNNVVINPTTPTNKPVGVTFYSIPALSYAFIGTKGSFPCLNDGGTTIGLAIAPSQSVAGAVKTGATTLDSIGRAQYTGVTTEDSIGSFEL